jgi:hypothetical protein
VYFSFVVFFNFHFSSSTQSKKEIRNGHKMKYRSVSCVIIITGYTGWSNKILSDFWRGPLRFVGSSGSA